MMDIEIMANTLTRNEINLRQIILEKNINKTLSLNKNIGHYKEQKKVGALDKKFEVGVNINHTHKNITPPAEGKINTLLRKIFW